MIAAIFRLRFLSPRYQGRLTADANRVAPTHAKRLAIPGRSSNKLSAHAIVARVRPRISKGITDLLLPRLSEFFIHDSAEKSTGEQRTCPTGRRPTEANRQEPTGHFCVPQRTKQLVCVKRSHSLSQLSRRFGIRIKNGHAPPSSESRKSYQSVNHSRVLI
jgi:hypothetical protein